MRDILIYTTNTCAYCVMVKRYLQSKGLTWTEINLDEQPERQQEAFQISGQLAVPVTLITDENDNKNVVIGYNLAKLASALA